MMCNAQLVTEPLEVKEKLRSRSCRAAREKRGRGFEMRDLEAFVPERWLWGDENGREVFDGSALTRLAFSLGPRGCFGMLKFSPPLFCFLLPCLLAHWRYCFSSWLSFCSACYAAHFWFGLIS